MAYLGTQYAATAAAVKLTTILGAARDIYPAYISIKSKTGNTGVLYLGPSTVTAVPANARESLSAGERWIYDPGTGSRGLHTGEIYLITSNATDPIFITVIE